jgi:hypothetical protein
MQGLRSPWTGGHSSACFGDYDYLARASLRSLTKQSRAILLRANFRQDHGGARYGNADTNLTRRNRLSTDYSAHSL